MAVVSADVKLQFDVPGTGEADSHERALWRLHHLPHNLDRQLNLDGPEVQHKRQLIEQMDQDRDRARRAEAFAQIHQINDQLVRDHPQAMAEARLDVQRAKIAQSNRAILNRRDWCFALYPYSAMQELVRALAD